RQSVGALNQTSQGRAFRQREVPSMFAKITARRRFRPVKTAPEVDPVQIQLHDLLFAELLLDPAGQKNLEQLAMKRPFLERKTVPGQLLGDRTCPLADMTGRDVLQRRPCDSKQIVAAMLIKFCVLHRDHRIDQVARQLLIWHRLAVLDVNLSKDLVVSIENHAGRLHLFEFAQIEPLGLGAQLRGEHGEINAKYGKDKCRDRRWNIKRRTLIPRRAKPIARRRDEMCCGCSHWNKGQTLKAQRSTLNVKLPLAGLDLGRWTLEVF